MCTISNIYLKYDLVYGRKIIFLGNKNESSLPFEVDNTLPKHILKVLLKPS